MIFSKSFCNISSSNFKLCAFIYITLIDLQLTELQAQVVIGKHGEYIKWNDCLYGKLVVPEEDAQCYKCSLNASQPSVPLSTTDWAQEFFNCTDSCIFKCDYRTICTKAKYYISSSGLYDDNDDTPVLRPLCYQCANRKDEVIWFESKYEYELCSIDCQGCASLVDITDAVKCAPICQGYPTFCFPVVKVYNQRVCYQATHWYGCKFIEINSSNPSNDTDGEDDEGSTLTEECQKCTLLLKGEGEAHHCSYACSWYPTYHKIDRDNITRFYQCRPHSVIKDKHNQLFLFNAPDEIMEYIYMSNSSFVYPHNLISGQETVLNGQVFRQVNGKFQIARMNAPLPHKYRSALYK